MWQTTGPRPSRAFTSNPLTGTLLHQASELLIQQDFIVPSVPRCPVSPARCSLLPGEAGQAEGDLQAAGLPEAVSEAEAEAAGRKSAWRSALSFQLFECSVKTFRVLNIIEFYRRLYPFDKPGEHLAGSDFDEGVNSGLSHISYGILP